MVSTLVLGTIPAGADNLTNDAATTSGITTFTVGGSTVITYQLVANSEPSGDVSGCDATISSPVTVTINTPGAPFPLGSFLFTGCGYANRRTETFSSQVAGSFDITHTISGGISGSKFNNNADFTLTVNPVTPANTAPTLTLPSDQTAEATGPAGATVTYIASVSDAEDGSLTPTCSPASGAVFPLGVTQVNCSVTDSGGLTTTGIFNVTVADTSPPSLDLPADITTQATGNSQATVTYTATATDLVDGSVPVSCSPASGSAFPAGTTTVNCSATDAHNNTATGSFTVTVVYGWAGFFQPVDNLPTVNTVKAGSAIPVKFSLGGNQGLNLFKGGSPASASYTCSGTAPTDAIEQTVTASTSSLSYDATTDQYTYVWKTDKAWAGSCRALVVKLADNTIRTANFQFTK